MTPTQLSLRHLRADGWTADVVERWNPHARVRQDLFGFLDIVALRGSETLGVQCTSAAGVSARVKKIGEAPSVSAVLAAGWRVVVWGWAKNDAGRWVLGREVVIDPWHVLAGRRVSVEMVDGRVGRLVGVPSRSGANRCRVEFDDRTRTVGRDEVARWWAAEA